MAVSTFTSNPCTKQLSLMKFGQLTRQSGQREVDSTMRTQYQSLLGGISSILTRGDLPACILPLQCHGSTLRAAHCRKLRLRLHRLEAKNADIPKKPLPYREPSNLRLAEASNNAFKALSDCMGGRVASGDISLFATSLPPDANWRQAITSRNRVIGYRCRRQCRIVRITFGGALRSPWRQVLLAVGLPWNILHRACKPEMMQPE